MLIYIYVHIYIYTRMCTKESCLTQEVVFVCGAHDTDLLVYPVFEVLTSCLAH